MAGADGCKAGWICVVRDGAGAISAQLHATARALLRQRPAPRVLAVDVPIGLSSRDPRDCDRAARALLGRGRASSVFPAPLRPALRARTREEASAITLRRSGRRVSWQSFHITSRIRDVDALLRRDPALRRRVREVHPEVSFWAWNGGAPLASGKKSRAGREERRALVDRHFGDGAFAATRARFRVADVAHDDLLDAFAALWTAERIRDGAAGTLPPDPPRDARGLPMEIVY